MWIATCRLQPASLPAISKMPEPRQAATHLLLALAASAPSTDGVERVGVGGCTPLPPECCGPSRPTAAGAFCNELATEQQQLEGMHAVPCCQGAAQEDASAERRAASGPLQGQPSRASLRLDCRKALTSAWVSGRLKAQTSKQHGHLARRQLSGSKCTRRARCCSRCASSAAWAPSSGRCDASLQRAHSSRPSACPWY